MVWKEFIHLYRDKRSLFIIIAFPALMLILYGYALSFDVKHIKVGVVDLDRSSESREFIRSLIAQETFDLILIRDSSKQLAQDLQEGIITVGVVIPLGFGKDMNMCDKTKIQALIDGSNSHASITTLGYLQTFVQWFLMRKIRERFEAMGLNFAFGGGSDLRVVVYYNPTLETAKFLVPGLVGILLTVMAVVSTALSLVREKERGTMIMLMVSPLSAWEVVLGKTIPYLLLSAISAFIVLSVGWGLFGVDIRGSIPLLCLCILLFQFGSLSMGVFISSITDSAQVAFTISAVTTMLPSFILSGFVFPIESMPDIIQIFSRIIPARYIIAILRAIVIKGEGIMTVFPEFLGLMVFAIVMVILASLMVRRGLLH